MPGNALPERDEFAGLVKDALTKLYDGAHLQTHLLATHLALPPSRGETKGEALRRVLRETMEGLKPPPSIPLRRPEWLGYRVLWTYYVRCVSREGTCRELGISDSTFHRYQHGALVALADVLWERARAESLGVEAAMVGAHEEDVRHDTMAKALSLASSQEAELLDLGEIVEGVRQTIAPLTEAQGIALCLNMPTEARACGSASAVRQLFLSVIAQGLKRSAGRKLELSAEVRGQETICRLSELLRLPSDTTYEGEAGFVPNRELLDICHSTVWFEDTDSGHCAALFSLPAPKPYSLLVIDDDPGAIALYRRFLQNVDCALLDASSLEQAEALLSDMRPDLILLDVIMPGTDGWDILLRLRQSPETTDIPIVVCSVMDQPELALALGASQVLSKPFGAEDLVRAIRMWIGLADT